MALTAADFRLGKAYGLGRALAQTALLPDAKHPETFQQTFARFRLDNLLGWLADLRSAFPPHAAEAVSGSLQAWAAWSDAPTLRPAVDGPGQGPAGGAPWAPPPSVGRPSTTRGRRRRGGSVGRPPDRWTGRPPPTARASPGRCTPRASCGGPCCPASGTAWPCCPPTTTCGRPTSSLATSAGSP